MDISKLSLNIEKVLGASVSKVSHLAQASSCLLYPAGNLIVFYSPILDEQITYLTHTSDAISSIVVSPNQEQLAVCENGKHGSATIYSIDDLQFIKENSREVKYVLKGHKFGIDHLVFSPNGRYILTLSNQDGSMFLWEEGQPITRNRIAKAISKILFDKNGDLLTIGRGYIKLWPFKQGIVSRKQENDQHIIEGKAMSFGKKFSTQDFVDAALLTKDGVQRLVLLSSQGLLCILMPGYEKIDKWIDVMMQGAIGLELIGSVALCCGDHALVKAVDLQQLAFKGKFPKPPPTSRENLSEQEPLECMENDEFPKCVGVKSIGQFVVTLYSNRSMFVWTFEQDGNIQAVRSILSHRAKVTCLTILQQVQKGQLVFFASAADDHTLRLWHCYGKGSEVPSKSVDVGALLGLKRNVYCRHLTHIIYTHSELPITFIRPYGKNAIACIARSQFLIYELENFGLSILENFQDERLTALECWQEYIYIGNDAGKVKICRFRDQKLEKSREISFQTGIERILTNSGRTIINGKGLTKYFTAEGQVTATYYKSQKIGIASTCLLSCEKKILNFYSLTKNKKTSSLPLNHELDQDQSIKFVKSNSWIVVLITTKNRLLVINFAATVLFSEELNHNITDLEVGQHGKIILSDEDGILIIKHQTKTGKYQQIDQKVKKWFQVNDMNWMDGSVWASKNKSTSAPSLQSKQGKSSLQESLQEKAKKNWGQADSIKVGTGQWADLSVSIKQPQLANVNLEYQNDDNKKSVFNPSSICAQVNQVYKDVKSLENKRKDVNKAPPLAQNKSGSIIDNSSLIEQKNLSSSSRVKRRIFGSKEKEEYKPKFTNNLVESIIDEPKSNKEKLTTGIQDPMIQTNKTHNQSASIDFGLSQDDSSPSNRITEQNLLPSKVPQTILQKPDFFESVGTLLTLPEEGESHDNIVSIVLEHGQQYQKLFKMLEKVFGEEQRQKRKQNLTKKMQILWSQMKKTIDKEG